MSARVAICAYILAYKKNFQASPLGPAYFSSTIIVILTPAAENSQSIIILSLRHLNNYPSSPLNRFIPSSSSLKLSQELGPARFQDI